MKYFTELLESYSKLKKRKLKLLSEADNGQIDVQAQSEADALIQSAKTSNGQEVPIEGSKGVIWVDKEGKVVTTLFGMTPTQVDQGTEGYQKLINYFSKKNKNSQGKPQAEDSTAEGNVLGQDLSKKTIIPWSTELDAVPLLEQNPLIGSETESGMKIRDTLIKMQQVFQDLKTTFGGERFERGGMGGGNVSLKRLVGKLLKPKFGIKITRKGAQASWDQYELPKSARTIQSASDKIYDLMDAISKAKGRTTEEDRTRVIEALKNFQIQKGTNDVVVKLDDDHGLVFTGSVTLKALINISEKKFSLGTGEKSREYKISKEKKNTGVDNAFRGTFMESYMKYANLSMIVNDKALPQEVRKSVAKVIQKEIKNIEGNIRRLAEADELWTRMMEETAIDTDTDFLIKTLKSVLKNLGGSRKGKEFEIFGSNIGRACQRAAQKSLEMGASYIATAGRVTGYGRRQDILHIFNNEDLAKQGLSKRSLKNKSDIAIKKVKLSQVLNAEDLEIAKSTGRFTEGQIAGTEDIYMMSDSLKNYLEVGRELTIGSTTRGSNSQFITQTISPKKLLEMTPEDQQASKDFFDKFILEMGISDVNEYLESVRKFNEDKIEKIWGTVNDLVKAETLYVKTPDGKSQIAEDPLKKIVSAMRSVIVAGTTHDQLTDDSSVVGKLHRTIEDLMDDEESDENIRKKIAIYGTLLGKAKAIGSGLTAENKDGTPNLELQQGSRRYLAAMLFNTAASVDDSLFLDVRDLNNSKNYGAMHNEVIMPIIKSVYNNDGEWMIEQRGNGFKFIHKDNPKHIFYLTDSTDRREDQKTGDVFYGLKTTAMMSKELLMHHDVYKDQTSERVIPESNMLQVFIETQKALLENLIKLQKESILQ